MFRKNNNNFNRNNFNSNNFNRNNFNGNNFNGNNFNGNNFNGKANRGKSKFFVVLLVLLLIGGAIWLKNEGKLGHYKNEVASTPVQQKAVINKGLGELTQANKNIANEEISKKGDKSAKNKIINNQTLLTDQITYLPDMLNMNRPVYSVFVFSNDNSFDKKWIEEVKKARQNEHLKVYTYNGNDCEETASLNINGFVSQYFYNNYEVDKNSKKYGKPDGLPHPFIVLVVKGKPEQIIVEPEDCTDLFKTQKELIDKADKNANNYKMPDNGVGIPYPDYKKYFENGKKAVGKIANKVEEKINN